MLDQIFSDEEYIRIKKSLNDLLEKEDFNSRTYESLMAVTTILTHEDDDGASALLMLAIACAFEDYKRDLKSSNKAFNECKKRLNQT